LRVQGTGFTVEGSGLKTVHGGTRVEEAAGFRKSRVHQEVQGSGSPDSSRSPGLIRVEGSGGPRVQGSPARFRVQQGLHVEFRAQVVWFAGLSVEFRAKDVWFAGLSVQIRANVAWFAGLRVELRATAVWFAGLSVEFRGAKVAWFAGLSVEFRGSRFRVQCAGFTVQGWDAHTFSASA